MANSPDSIQIHIAGTEAGHTLLEFSRLLYHLDLIYESARLATDAKYRRYQFPEHTFRPLVSPLDLNDQMILSRVRHESPWELSVLLRDPITVLTGGLGALWLFVQCLERLSTLGLNRRKLKAEIEKLQLEADNIRRESVSDETPHRRAIIQGEEDIPKRESDGLKAPVVFVEPPDSNGLLIPPAESMRLYRRLARRGAQRFYESNINSIRRLGFEVKDFDIETRREER
jgi:hypothetical protein